MENNKYYTPTIEEFHVGFEYELLTLKGDWLKSAIDAQSVFTVLRYYSTNTRVKYLDQEDIESLGWVKGSDWVGDNDYYTHSNGKFRLIIETYNDYKTILIETLAGFKYYNYLESIKNKSELKKLMKQLGIYE